MGLIRTRGLIDLRTHAARQPGENQTWRGRENIHLRFVQLSHARKHYPLCACVCVGKHVCVCVCVIAGCVSALNQPEKL